MELGFIARVKIWGGLAHLLWRRAWDWQKASNYDERKRREGKVAREKGYRRET